MQPNIEFAEEVATALAYYVYRLVDPRSGATFYVGKGKGNRVFQHVRGAIAGETGLKYDRIREIRDAGLEPRIIIHRHGLDEPMTFLIEAALIDAYDDLHNSVRGHGTELGVMTVSEVLELYGAPPANISVPAILIKIERQWTREMSPEALYETTRKWWACNPEGRKIKPKYAIAVARGLIREVFEIQRWEKGDMAIVDAEARRAAEESGTAWSRSRWRRAFIGNVAPDIVRSDLIGKSVRDVRFGQGSPIAYVGCENETVSRPPI